MRLSSPLLAFAVVAQIVALERPEAAALPLLCGDWRWLMTRPADALDLVLRVVGPAALVGGWASMLILMMPPLLGWPLTHVWQTSRRPRALGLFLLAYGCVWLMAGVPLVTCALALRLMLGDGLGPMLLGTFAALLWSGSPWQTIALERGHRAMRGGALDRDVIAFGMTQAGWCLLACWPWMVTPLLAGVWHAPVMAAATAAMVIECAPHPAARAGTCRS